MSALLHKGPPAPEFFLSTLQNGVHVLKLKICSAKESVADNQPRLHVTLMS